MAYRKTEKVLAKLEAKRAVIIAAAIDVIAKVGMDSLTTDMVADRAEIAKGLIYRYFADRTELVAAVVALVLERDIVAIREQSNTANAISWLCRRFALDYRLMGSLGREPVYREGMKRELVRFIKATDPAESPSILAAATFGAIYEAAGIGPRVEPNLTSVLCKALGVPVSKKAVAVA